MAKLDPQIATLLEWIGFVRPTGLVVSAPALVKVGATLDRRDSEGQHLGWVRSPVPGTGRTPASSEFWPAGSFLVVGSLIVGPRGEQGRFMLRLPADLGRTGWVGAA